MSEFLPKIDAYAPELGAPDILASIIRASRLTKLRELRALLLRCEFKRAFWGYKLDNEKFESWFAQSDSKQFSWQIINKDNEDRFIAYSHNLDMLMNMIEGVILGVKDES